MPVISRPAHPLTGGFTLVELLVSMTILSAILLVTAQITTSARDSIHWAKQKITCDTAARQLTSLLDRDLHAMIRRPDAPFQFDLRPGNDRLTFLASRAGYARGDGSADRAASLVRYENDAQGRFSRACLGFGFDGDETLQLVPNATLPAIPDSNRQVVSDDVFRVEFEFLVDTGESVVRQQKAPNTLKPLRGFVTSVAVLASPAYSRLPPGGLAKLAALFADSSAGKTPADLWTETVNHHSGHGVDGIPPDVFRGIRIYEQTHLLD